MSWASVLLSVVEDSTEFDPTKVTPGVEGFLFTAGMAVLVIVLGFTLVGRLRRNAYRHEVRDQIAAEQAEAAGSSNTEADSEPRA